MLDFYLIKKLKENFNSLNDVILKNNFDSGQGFTQRKGKGKNKSDFIQNKRYLDSKLFSSKFNIDSSLFSKYDDKSPLYRPGIKTSPPYVLLKRAFKKNDFSMISAYTEDEYVFSNLITAISGTNKSVLKTIAGVLNSIVHSYFLLLQGASAGVEREESFNEERFQFPFVSNANIPKTVDKIQKLYKEQNLQILFDNSLEMQIKSEEAKLNEIILNSFKLSIIEKAVIDYAIKITIPQINNREEPIAKSTEKQLENYSNIFYLHFSNRWNSFPTFFSIDIYY